MSSGLAQGHRELDKEGLRNGECQQGLPWGQGQEATEELAKPGCCSRCATGWQCASPTTTRSPPRYPLCRCSPTSFALTLASDERYLPRCLCSGNFQGCLLLATLETDCTLSCQQKCREFW